MPSWIDGHIRQKHSDYGDRMLYVLNNTSSCRLLRLISYIGSVIMAVLVFHTSLVFGANIYVPNEYQTIQAAIDAALDGDTVLVADGIYRGSGNKNILFNGKAITVKSENGPENCIIDCEYSGRGFNFINEEGENSVLSGFTIINGYAWLSDVGFTGGGVNCHYFSSPTITNCIITGNQAELGGGGIYCGWDSSPSITNCIISNNISKTSGGGIEAHLRSSPTIAACIIVENIAYYSGGGIICAHGSAPNISSSTISKNITYFDEGGGISANAASPTITNCTISLNQAKAGGGLYFYSCPISPHISNSNITGNLALSGGGIYWEYTSPVINKCSITGNQSIETSNPTSGYGGGIFCGRPNYVGQGKLAPSIVNSIISGNSAAKSGGAIYAKANEGCTRSVFITNCLIGQNRAPQGGGLFLDITHCDIAYTITNCTISRNEANDSGGIHFSELSSASKITNTIIWGNTSDQINLSNIDVTYSNISGGYAGVGNINRRPYFVCASRQNYRLGASSPCIDAGTSVNAPNIDIVGSLRPQGNGYDMGAYEGKFSGTCGISPSILNLILY